MNNNDDDRKAAEDHMLKVFTTRSSPETSERLDECRADFLAGIKHERKRMREGGPNGWMLKDDKTGEFFTAFSDRDMIFADIEDALENRDSLEELSDGISIVAVKIIEMDNEDR